MAYSVRDDIIDALPLDDLIALTDDDGLGMVNDAVLARAIADADSLIDAYCEGRYQLPLNPVPAIIRRLSVDFAIYNLYSRRAVDMPDGRSAAHKNGLEFLEKVAARQISLGAAGGQAAETPVPGMVAGNDRLFSRNRLRGGM